MEYAWRIRRYIARMPESGYPTFRTMFESELAETLLKWPEGTERVIIVDGAKSLRQYLAIFWKYLIFITSVNIYPFWARRYLASMLTKPSSSIRNTESNCWRVKQEFAIYWHPYRITSEKTIKSRNQKKTASRSGADFLWIIVGVCDIRNIVAEDYRSEAVRLKRRVKTWWRYVWVAAVYTGHVHEAKIYTISGR